MYAVLATMPSCNNMVMDSELGHVDGEDKEICLIVVMMSYPCGAAPFAFRSLLTWLVRIPSFLLAATIYNFTPFT
jgi:hypothetical protein